MVSGRIPVQIMWIADAEGGGDVEIMMDLESFERSDTSILASIKKLRGRYLATVGAAKKSYAEDAPSGDARVSARKRWKTCNTLTRFVDDASSQYTITNYTQALSRDLGLPERSVKTLLDFGRCFTEDEMFDQIPYSVYREFVFRINLLRSAGAFELEKKKLLAMRYSHSMPSSSKYRRHLTEVVEAGMKSFPRTTGHGGA